MDETRDFKKQDSDIDGNPVKGKYRNDRIGPLIEQARLALNMSKAELAERSGIDESTLSKIEKDASEARMMTLRKIIEIGLNGRIDFVISLK